MVMWQEKYLSSGTLVQGIHRNKPKIFPDKVVIIMVIIMVIKAVPDKEEEPEASSLHTTVHSSV